MDDEGGESDERCARRATGLNLRIQTYPCTVRWVHGCVFLCLLRFLS